MERCLPAAAGRGRFGRNRGALPRLRGRHGRNRGGSATAPILNAHGKNLTAKEAGTEPASLSSDSLAIPTLNHSAFSRLLADFKRLINRHLPG
jgi:hypothetical protein